MEDFIHAGVAALLVQAGVGGHGVAGEVHPRDLLLHVQLVHGGEVLGLVQGRLSGLGGTGGVEKAHLALHVPALVRLQGVQHALHGEEHLPAVVAKIIQGAALYQAFNGTAVQLPAGHALAEVVKRGELPAAPALLHHAGDDAPAQVLHGQQAKADALAHHGEARLAEVDVGRQHGNAQAAALLDVLGHLAGLAQHAGEQRGHVLAGVVALEVGRLVGHHGVAAAWDLLKA